MNIHLPRACIQRCCLLRVEHAGSAAASRRLLADATAGSTASPPCSFLRNEHAAEEVMGTLMLLGILAIGSSSILAFGYPALRDAQAAASTQIVEHGFTALDSGLSKAALGRAPYQSVPVPLVDGTLSVRNESWLRVELWNATAMVDCLNFTLGSIVYATTAGRSVAWEGGGLWTAYPGGGQAMLSSPEFHYDGATLTLPILQVQGNASTSGKGTATLRVQRAGQPLLYFPTSIPHSSNCWPGTPPSRVNPLPVVSINVTVRSEYYEAWAGFVSAQITPNVTTNIVNETATVRLVTPTTTNPFTEAIFASDDIVLWNNFNSRSYNSATALCSAAVSPAGSVYAATSVLLKNNVLLGGNATTAGSLTLNNNAAVTGTCQGNPVTLGSGASCGTVNQQAAPVRSLTSPDSTISSKVSGAASSNDNAAAEAGDPDCNAAITGTVLDINGGSSCVIGGPKTLYFTKFTVKNNDGSGQALIFDTSGGAVDVAIANSGEFTLENNVNITVRGLNPVRFYTGSGAAPASGKDYFNNNVCIAVNPTPGLACNSAVPAGSYGNTNLMQFWFHSTGPDFVFGNNVDFNGVIYAPGRDMTLDNNVEICGAVVGDEVDVRNNVVLRYDENLANAGSLGAEAVLQYLHITLNTMSVAFS